MFPKDALKDLNGTVIQRELEITEEVELLPPLSEPEVRAVEKMLGMTCAAHIRDMLLFSRGLGCGVFGKSLDFSQVVNDGSIVTISERGLCLSPFDANEKFYVDLTTDLSSWDKVFFVSSEPAVMILQSESLPDFLFNFVRQEIYPDQQILLTVDHPDVQKVLKTNHHILTQPEAVAHQDVLISTFAEELEEDWSIIDLRYMGVGEGLPLELFGKNTECRRCGEQYIFALRENPNPPSFMKRLLRKKA